ncbi:hypothetical protein [Pelagibacterium halotolerans]|uniref:hypothetical protein n=1 Tax=Pelagibacterium halotolerans TaxID=531813 RepID=UPI0006813E0D|nr:hypothetical protein [Pelagibacterium halotolerans]
MPNTAAKTVARRRRSSLFGKARCPVRTDIGVVGSQYHLDADQENEAGPEGRFDDEIQHFALSD